MVGIMSGIWAHDDFGSHTLEAGVYSAAQIGHIFVNSLIELHNNETISVATPAAKVEKLLIHAVRLQQQNPISRDNDMEMTNITQTVTISSRCNDDGLDVRNDSCYVVHN